MKNLFLVLMACCLFTSCKPNTQSDISAELAISSLEAFYSNLDVDTYGPLHGGKSYVRFQGF